MELSDSTRGSGGTRKLRMFPLEIRKHFFAVKSTNHWHRLPREIVVSLSLEIFKNHLDTVLSNEQVGGSA